MFKSSSARKAAEQAAELDFTQGLRNPNSYQLGHLADLGLGSEVTATAHDPVQSLLAVGTEKGMLHVFGGPGVHFSWHIGRELKIKHLIWRAGSGYLCAVDSSETLSVYDLARIERGKPVRDSSLSMRSVITCVEHSPAYPFLFLGGVDGTVDVYDLDRGCLSPSARIPNLWLSQDELNRRSGVFAAPSRRQIPGVTDVKLHPLDPNLVLIAYDGGVASWHIADKAPGKHWELVLPPGAPGGGNDPDEILFEERRLKPTCLAWRADGLIFAVGTEEGCIAFCSVEDENLLQLRTIERADVNKMTEDDLFGAQGGGRRVTEREPIFKLAWSAFPVASILEGWTAGSAPTSPTSPASPASPKFDADMPRERSYADGTTILSILGGLCPQDPTGIHMLELPPFVPPSGQATSGKTGNLSTKLREALNLSVHPVRHDLYSTTTPPEDFILFPRSSPYYSLSYDPNAILVTLGPDTTLPVPALPSAARALRAWSFPPPANAPSPQELQLPAALSFGGGGTCTSAQLVTTPTLTYRRMLHQLGQLPPNWDRIPLKGGKAFAKLRDVRQGVDGPSGEAQPRILVTSHTDLSVRFWDVSDRLLAGGKGNSRLGEDWPRPLAHLTFDVVALLLAAESKGLEASRVLIARPWELEIEKVSFAKENCELAVLLSTGEVVVAKLEYGDKPDPAAVQSPALMEAYANMAEDSLNATVQDALQDLNLDRAGPSSPAYGGFQPSQPTSPTFDNNSRRASILRKKSTARSPKVPSSVHTLDPQDLHIDISGFPPVDPYTDGFRPVAAFTVPEGDAVGAIKLVTLSDVGFVAASSGAALVIADLRKCEVLLAESSTVAMDSAKGKGKHGARADNSPITSHCWTIAPCGDDHDRTPRLIVTQASGAVRVFELGMVAGDWILSEKVASFQHDSVKGAFDSFVFDQYGNEALAAPMQLQQALNHHNNFSADDARGALTGLWVTVSPTNLACYTNISGAKVAGYEDRQAGFMHAQVVHRLGSPVLLVSTKHRHVLAFSLPDLKNITRLTFPAAIHTSAGQQSISQDGDVVQLLTPLEIRVHTCFDSSGRAGFPPRLELWNAGVAIPVAPGAVSNTVKSWATWAIGSSQRTYLPYEVENILGGPNRKPAPVRDRSPPVLATATPGSATPPTRSGSGARTPVTQASRIRNTQGDLDNTTSYLAQTQEALAKRGEYLEGLKSGLDSFAKSAEAFAKEAKKEASGQAMKQGLSMGWKSGLSQVGKKLGM